MKIEQFTLSIVGDLNKAAGVIEFNDKKAMVVIHKLKIELDCENFSEVVVQPLLNELIKRLEKL